MYRFRIDIKKRIPRGREVIGGKLRGYLRLFEEMTDGRYEDMTISRSISRKILL